MSLIFKLAISRRRERQTTQQVPCKTVDEEKKTFSCSFE
jgi:hypothetical protein